MQRIIVSVCSCATGLVLLLLASSIPSTSTDAFLVQAVELDQATLHVLQARYRSLSKQLSQLMPGQPYIVVDTARNHLYIKRRDQVMLDALASTGSGTILDKPGEAKGQWIFDTPRGEFTVQSKLVNPVWVKPDWAFIEEGVAIPKSAADRIESGVKRFAT